MPWFVLVVSGLFEAVWAAALSESDGLTRPGPVAVFAVALAISMGGLGYALRTIPVGTGYAVWVSVGVLGAAVYGVLAHGDALSPARAVCFVAILGGVIGLKLTG